MGQSMKNGASIQLNGLVSGNDEAEALPKANKLIKKTWIWPYWPRSTPNHRQKEADDEIEKTNMLTVTITIKTVL